MFGTHSKHVLNVGAPVVTSTWIKVKNSFANTAGLIVISAIVTLISVTACNDEAPQISDETRIAELARKVNSARAEVADMEQLVAEVKGLEDRLVMFSENMDQKDGRDRVTAILAVNPVKVLRIPDYIDETIVTGPLKLKLVEMKIAADWNESLRIMLGIENSWDLSIHRLNFRLHTLDGGGTATFVVSSPEEIVLEESVVPTEEIELVEPPSGANSLDKIAALEKLLEGLEKKKIKYDVLKKRKSGINAAFEALEQWRDSRPRPFNFLIDLPLRWPIGIPELKRVELEGNIISLYGDGTLDEVSPFLLEFHEHLKEWALPFTVNISPLLGDSIDGREMTVNRVGDRLLLEWEGFPVLDLPAAEISSVALDTESVYLLLSSETVTHEESLGDSWIPSPARAIKAINIRSGGVIWEISVEGDGPVTNIILDQEGRLIYAQGNTANILSTETGEKLGTVELKGHALEMVSGAWGRVSVYLRTSRNTFELTPLESGGEQ